MSDDFGGFFDGVDDIEDVSNDPFFMEDGVYRWKVVSAEAKKTNAGDKTGLNVKLQCVEGAYRGNTQYSPWRRIPFRTDGDFASGFNSDDESTQADTMASFRKLQAQLRKDFEAYGVGADELKTIKPADLIGREVMGRIRNETQDNGDTSRRIVGLYPADEVSGPDGQGGFGDFASSTDGGFNANKTNDDVPF